MNNLKQKPKPPLVTKPTAVQMITGLIAVDIDTNKNTISVSIADPKISAIIEFDQDYQIIAYTVTSAGKLFGTNTDHVIIKDNTNTNELKSLVKKLELNDRMKVFADRSLDELNFVLKHIPSVGVTIINYMLKKNNWN